MQYLVQMKLVPQSRPLDAKAGAAFFEDFIRPTLELGKKLQDEKKIIAGGPVSGKAGDITGAISLKKFPTQPSTLARHHLLKVGSGVVSASATTPEPVPSWRPKTHLSRFSCFVREKPRTPSPSWGISRWLVRVGEGSAAPTERGRDAEALPRLCRDGR